jgi:DNA polymerase-1
VQAVAAAAYVGLDTEATDKDPYVATLRLVQLAIGPEVFVIDCAAIDPAPLWPALARTKLVVCNAAYDLVLLWRKGFEPGRVCDLLLMSRLLTAGTAERNGLKDLALRYLNLTLDKEEQTSDWTGELTQAQLDYAALDARITFDLCRPIMAAIHTAKLTKIADVENRTAPALCWLARAGAPFGLARWDALATGAGQEAEQHRAALDALSPFTVEAWKEIGLKEKKPPNRWNWGSARQVAKAFERVGLTLKKTEKGLPSTSKETLAKIDHPIAKALIAYNDARDRADYGRKWAKFVRDGRVYGQWSQIGSSSGPENVTGRTSVSDPPLQAVRKDLRYRQCFVAPPGRVWIKADYNQLQLRIAAKITGDRAMCAAYAAGGDLHSVTALRVTGQAQVTKEERSLAKSLNFGLLFGMGVERFQTYTRSEYGIDLTLERAVRLRNEHFAAYPGLREWHNQQGRKHIKETRSILGRRRLFPRPRFTEQLASPVQGSEADGAKLALALLYERRHLCPGAFPVLFVHDEIDVEADASQADAAAAWLKDAMMDGMREILAPIPCVVEVDILPTWGGVPDPSLSPPSPSPDSSSALSPPAAAESNGVSAAPAPPSGSTTIEGNGTITAPPALPTTTEDNDTTPPSLPAGGNDQAHEDRISIPPLPSPPVPLPALPPAPITLPPVAPDWFHVGLGQSQGVANVLVADCRTALAQLPSASVDSVPTDPPYNIGQVYGSHYDDRQSKSAFLGLLEEAARQILRVLKPNGSLWMIMGSNLQAEVKVMLERVGFHCRSTIIWHETFGEAQQNNFTPSWRAIHYMVKNPTNFIFNADAVRVPSQRQLKYKDKRARAGGKLPDDTWLLRHTWVLIPGEQMPELITGELDIWLASRECGTFKSKVAHVNQMPLPIMDRIIKVATHPGQIVLDPFYGTGTTGVAAAALGRRHLGIELSEKTAALAREEFAQRLAAWRKHCKYPAAGEGGQP